jgi:hypothetical protein
VHVCGMADVRQLLWNTLSLPLLSVREKGGSGEVAGMPCGKNPALKVVHQWGFLPFRALRGHLMGDCSVHTAARRT